MILHEQQIAQVNLLPSVPVHAHAITCISGNSLGMDNTSFG